MDYILNKPENASLAFFKFGSNSFNTSLFQAFIHSPGERRVKTHEEHYPNAWNRLTFYKQLIATCFQHLAVVHKVFIPENVSKLISVLIEQNPSDNSVSL